MEENNAKMEIDPNNKKENMKENNSNIKIDSNNKKESKKNKKSKKRMYIVLLFILLVLIIGYIIYRGEYLEILEIGEEYVSIFWQNVNYTAITFGINFIFLFILPLSYYNVNRAVAYFV